MPKLSVPEGSGRRIGTAGMKQTNDAAAFGFGGGKPVSNRTLRKFRARRRVAEGFPWEGKFETREQVEAYLAGDKIQCLLCGRHMKRLAMHLPKIHGVSEDEYRVRYGLAWRRGLTCDETRERYSQAMLRDEERHRRLSRMAGQYRPLTVGVKARPKAPFIIKEFTEQALAIAGRETIWTSLDYEAILTTVAQEKISFREAVLKLGGPHISAFYAYRRANPDYARRCDEAFDALPFAVQAKSHKMSPRFHAEVRKLFDLGLSDKKIAAALGVTTMTSNRVTRHWRASERMAA